LGWDPSSSTNVAGYYIYYGTDADNLTNEWAVSVNGASSTSVTLYGLTAGETYYFAASSYDSNYFEGALSSAISIEPGSVAPPAGGVLNTLRGLPAGEFGFTLSGSGSGQYIVQASTDLVHWAALQTNSGSFTFVDSNAAQFPRRFYRTLYSSN
ncbi:MAG: fibronectin type III domain-containing protein, partial [Limisphaerales bacterium]